MDRGEISAPWTETTETSFEQKVSFVFWQIGPLENIENDSVSNSAGSDRDCPSEPSGSA